MNKIVKILIKHSVFILLAMLLAVLIGAAPL